MSGAALALLFGYVALQVGLAAAAIASVIIMESAA